MQLSFEVLGKRHLTWLCILRNQNREWFMDSDVKDMTQTLNWFLDSADRGDLNLLLKDGEERIGFISVYNINGGGANIGRMMTDDKYKRKGYMERAMIKVFNICKTYLDIECLTLEVKKSNIPARDLYVRMGFVTYGITQETLIMRKVF